VERERSKKENEGDNRRCEIYRGMNFIGSEGKELLNPKVGKKQIGIGKKNTLEGGRKETIGKVNGIPLGVGGEKDKEKKKGGFGFCVATVSQETKNGQQGTWKKRAVLETRGGEK